MSSRYPVNDLHVHFFCAGIQTSQDARFYAVSSKFSEPFANEDKNFVVQFSVKHEQIIDCGGGYVKLFPSEFKPEEMEGESPYNIMFGGCHMNLLTIILCLSAWVTHSICAHIR